MVNETVCSEERNQGLGIIYIILGSTYLSFYLPCIWAMCHKPFITRSCYKIMVAIGLVDLGLLATNTYLSGYWSIFGVSICNSYWNMKIVGAFVNAEWIAYCSLCLTLAINRALQCGQATNEEPRFFGGQLLWLWLFGAVVYSSLFLVIFLSPCCTMIYQSGLGLWLFDPGSDHKIGLLAHFINNTLFSVVMITLYAIVMVRVGKMGQSDGQASMTHAEKSILLQSFIVCSLATVLAISYLVVPMITANFIALVLMALYNQFVAGSNGLIYLMFNRAIRRKIKSMFSKSGTVEPEIMELKPLPKAKSISLKPRPATTHYVHKL